jgi:hypothetical protein
MIISNKLLKVSRRYIKMQLLINFVEANATL